MDNQKISKNRQKKEQVVAEMAEKASKASAIVLTNYQGLTHQQLEAIKKAAREVDAEFTITKNTLLKLAMEKDNLPTDTEALDKPTATLFAYQEPIAALKQLTGKLKEFGLPTIKFGVLEGKALTASEVEQLAQLPGREVLLTQIVGGMKSPIFGLHRALNWNLQKFVMTLNAIASTKH